MKNRKPWFSLLIVFVVMNALFLAFQHRLVEKGFSTDVLIIGNLILFMATLLSFVVFYKTLRSPNPQASMRGLYGSFMIKFFICVIAAFAYIMIARKSVNKPSLFFCMALYIVYTVIEVSSLSRMLKQQKNA
ncbi:MAG: hypothetical protein IPP93_16760 [Chitinophagaceae bacterium]|nr:hypothetical protein [Chitinophagaceae bacterium]MBL0334039.1 hypothetical protein [Chitinophagaceae bacterium]